MKKFALPIIMVAALGLVGLGWIVTQDNGVANDTRENSSGQTAEQVAPAANQLVVADDGRSLSHNGSDGQDALSVLRSLTDVETEDSEFGEYVTTINGVTADATSEYWAFYVNGELASVGADSYESMDSDTIEWKLESF